MNKFEIARNKYKPELIYYLLIAEAPPKFDSDRFFYFEKVNDRDSLFLETMKVLFPTQIDSMSVKELRANKIDFLIKFKEAGYYLIDSVGMPFETNLTSAQKIKKIKSEQTDLLLRVKSLVNNKTKVILISATVFKANYMYLKENNLYIIHDELVDFPGSGGQINYREKMKNIITGHNSG